MIKDGKLKFKESNGPAGVEDLFRAKVEVIRQEKEAPIEASFWKVVMPRDVVSIVKIERSKVGGSSTTKRLKEQSCEPKGEEEKRTL